MATIRVQREDFDAGAEAEGDDGGAVGGVEGGKRFVGEPAGDLDVFDEQPQQFLPDSVGPVGTPVTPVSIWRSDPQVHRDWLRTLSVRGAELDRLLREQIAVIQNADAAVLPVARDAVDY